MRFSLACVVASAVLAVAGCGSSSNSGGGGNSPTPPAVTSTTPASGATGIAINSAVTATFSQAMNSSSLTTSTFTLNSSGGAAVASAVTYSSTRDVATLTPGSNLAYSTQYTATITTSATDSSGTALAANYSWSFTTAAAPTPPTVTSTTPASGASNVATGTAVTAIFSQAMNASSLTASTFTLADQSGNSVAGTVTYSSSNNTATFTPMAALAYGTQYTATITTGATDSNGTALAENYSWNFTTGAAPLSVTAETPGSDAINVGVGTAITATFSQPMNASTLTTSTFTLMDQSGNAVAGSVTYSSSNDTATFTPTAPLAYSTSYTASITTGAMDTSGVALTTSFTWTFTTGTAPAAPTVTSTIPASGATGVVVTTAVSASFSEPMNASSITSSTFTVVAQGGSSVAGTVSYNASTMTATFTPSANLTYDTTYTATLTTGITNSTGQSLAATDWSFTTIEAPTVLSTTPSGGSTSVPVTDDVTATFSQAMNPSTLTTSTFTLKNGGIPVTGTVTYSSSSDTATFMPSASLAYDTSYTAEITTGATNSGGVPLTANYSWSFTTETAPSGMVTVDYGTADQIIRGFGGSTAWLGQLTTPQANELFSQTSGLGLSILRVRIDPTGSASSTPYAWATSNWAQEAANGTEAVAANPRAIVFATPWTPPASLKTSSSTEPFSSSCSPAAGFCGGYLPSSNYAAYASYLEDFVTYFNNTSNANLYAISMQNEPDANVTYESCFWAPQSGTGSTGTALGAQMDAWIAGDASTLTTNLIMPESEDFNTDYSSDALSDPNAVNLISIIGGHLYGYGEVPFYYTQAEDAGKDVWMTEHYLNPSGGFGAAPTITDALAAAEEVHNSMVTGQYNAYVWWWIWNDDCDGVNYGLINDGTGESGNACGTSAQPAPTYYGYAIGQFSKFIQPGYYRYNATPTPSSGVYISAYSGTDSGGTTHYVIVAINATTSPVSQPFTIDNATVTSMTPWQTTSSAGLAQQSAVTVSDGTFTYTLPAQSITTFVQ